MTQARDGFPTSMGCKNSNGPTQLKCLIYFDSRPACAMFSLGGRRGWPRGLYDEAGQALIFRELPVPKGVPRKESEA